MRDTIDMAHEARIIDFRDAYSEEHVQAILQDLKRFEALVRADEREACAKVCDEDIEKWKSQASVEQVAAAIRARGNNAA